MITRKNEDKKFIVKSIVTDAYGCSFIYDVKPIVNVILKNMKDPVAQKIPKWKLLQQHMFKVSVRAMWKISKSMKDAIIRSVYEEVNKYLNKCQKSYEINKPRIAFDPGNNKLAGGQKSLAKRGIILCKKWKLNLFDWWMVAINMNECKLRKWSFKLFDYKQKFFDNLYNIVKDYKLCFGDWVSSKTPNAKSQRGPNRNRNILKFF